MRPLAFIAFTISIASVYALSGCGVGGGVVATENDRLRARTLDLEGQVKTLTGKAAELETHLAQAAKAPSSVPADIIANTPRVTGIALSRLSQAHDDNGDGKPDSLIIYLEPSDGLGRFLQIVGHVSMHAAVLPAEGPAKTIGQKTFAPSEVRDGYRSAFTGQYYAFTLPIDAPPLPPPQPMPAVSTATQPAVPGTASSEPAKPQLQTQCTVRVEYTDGYTGQKFSTERVIDLR